MFSGASVLLVLLFSNTIPKDPELQPVSSQDRRCVKAWELRLSYESGTVYLADTASFIIQQCTYELPALKSEMKRAEKELAELQRRQGEYTRLAHGASERFLEQCAKRFIEPCEGHEIEDRLRACTSQLPPIFLSVAGLCQSAELVQATDLYVSFVRFSLSKAAATATATAVGVKGGGAGKKGAGAGAKGGGADAREAVVATVEQAEAVADGCLQLLRRVQRLSLESLKEAEGA
eukprot:5277795-Pleurochrysis_carterae.AAC.1